MGGHGWWSYIQHDDKKPKPEINRALLRRVFAYGRPYWKYVSIVLVCIAVTSLLDLLPPLIFRELIDHVLPEKNVGRLNLLALGLFGVPLINGIINVVQRNFSARAGEGIIFDLRTAMYNHLQRMGIRFFTDTKAGDIVSRFNSDVVGAQSAVTSTIPDIVTNVLTLISTFIVMLTIECSIGNSTSPRYTSRRVPLASWRDRIQSTISGKRGTLGVCGAVSTPRCASGDSSSGTSSSGSNSNTALGSSRRAKARCDSVAGSA